MSTRDAATLLPIIQSHTVPGTIIHSDQWRAYNSVNTIPAVASHHIINHSLHFVDPATGVHTQTVESYWNRVKTKLKRMKGCDGNQLPSYLDEFMWRERQGRPPVRHCEISYATSLCNILCSILIGFCVHLQNYNYHNNTCMIIGISSYSHLGQQSHFISLTHCMTIDTIPYVRRV